MIEIINDMVFLASELDKNGLHKQSNIVDKASESILNLKTAQYVGVQGYWVRNTRCWQNCYRQKRARNKNMPAQEVWASCQKEYEKSISNDNSGWEKYANDKHGLKKIASSYQINEKLVNKIVSENKRKFDKKILGKISSGMSPRKAIESTASLYSLENFNHMVDQAEKIKSLSLYLDKNNYKQLSKIASNISLNIVKESQFWNQPTSVRNPNQGWLSNLWDKTRSFTRGGELKNMRNRIYQLLNSLHRYSKDPEYLSRNFNQLVNSLHRESNNLAQSAGNARNEITQQIASSATNAIESFISNSQYGNIGEQLFRLSNNLRQILSNVDNYSPQDIGEGSLYGINQERNDRDNQEIQQQSTLSDEEAARILDYRGDNDEAGKQVITQLKNVLDEFNKKYESGSRKFNRQEIAVLNQVLEFLNKSFNPPDHNADFSTGQQISQHDQKAAGSKDELIALSSLLKKINKKGY